MTDIPTDPETPITIPNLPTDLEFGYVAGRFLRAYGDTTLDEDDLPDITAAQGQGAFTPVVDEIYSDTPVSAMIVSDPVPFTIDSNGYLTDPGGNVGCWLVVGSYAVAATIQGRYKKTTITVTTAHTEATPLDLPPQFPLVVAPPAVPVVNEAIAIRAEAAADRAEAAAASVEDPHAPEGGWLKLDLASAVQASLNKADTAFQLPPAGISASQLTAAVVTSLGKADSASQPGHTHTAAQISDASTIGRNVLTAADQQTARSAIGALGSARLVTAGTGLTGGGALTSDITLALTAATIASLAKADTAVQPAALTTALASKADLVGGVIPTSQIPALSVTTRVSVASQAAMLALTTAQVQPGDIAVRTDIGVNYMLGATDPSVLGNWIALDLTGGGAVASVNGQTGAVTLAAADVGAVATSAFGNSTLLSKNGSGTIAGMPYAATATAGAVALRNSLGDVQVNTTPTNSTDATSKSYTDTQDALRAPLASPALTGTPTAPTAAVDTSTTQLATTAYALGTGDQTAATASTVGAGSIALPSTGSRAVRHQLQGSVTYTMAAGTSGRSYTVSLVIAQDATGGRLVTWPTSIKWAGGTKPTLSTAASAVDIVTLLWTGTEWLGFAGGVAFA